MKAINKIGPPLAAACLVSLTGPAMATTIDEVLVLPTPPGNAWSGTFAITPSQPLWAFGVGNDAIQDTSISGISFIDGLEANDHWISSLISRSSWDNGFNFDSIRPIGATPPSSFSMDTSIVPWQWGANTYVAFYWLSEDGDDPGNPLAVLQPGTPYDAFKFFPDAPGSPFAAFTQADGGGSIIPGETIEIIVPTPMTGILLLIGLGPVARVRARRA